MMETAEEFAYELDHCNSHSWSGSSFDRKEAASLIRERDAAVALDVIRYLEQIAENMRWVDDRNMLTGVAKLLREKYIQPPQKSQEGG